MSENGNIPVFVNFTFCCCCCNSDKNNRSETPGYFYWHLLDMVEFSNGFELFKIFVIFKGSSFPAFCLFLFPVNDNIVTKYHFYCYEKYYISLQILINISYFINNYMGKIIEIVQLKSVNK